jgi:hypothetical protein
MEKEPAEEPAGMLQFFQTFPSCCIPDATEIADIHFSVCGTRFGVQFIVNETLSIKQDLQLNFASCGIFVFEDVIWISTRERAFSPFLPYHTVFKRQ